MVVTVAVVLEAVDMVEAVAAVPRRVQHLAQAVQEDMGKLHRIPDINTLYFVSITRHELILEN